MTKWRIRFQEKVTRTDLRRFRNDAKHVYKCLRERTTLMELEIIFSNACSIVLIWTHCIMQHKNYPRPRLIAIAVSDDSWDNRVNMGWSASSIFKCRVIRTKKQFNVSNLCIGFSTETQRIRVCSFFSKLVHRGRWKVDRLQRRETKRITVTANDRKGSESIERTSCYISSTRGSTQ